MVQILQVSRGASFVPYVQEVASFGKQNRRASCCPNQRFAAERSHRLAMIAARNSIARENRANLIDSTYVPTRIGGRIVCPDAYGPVAITF